MRNERCLSGEEISKWENKIFYNHSYCTLDSNRVHRCFEMPAEDTDTGPRVEELQWAVCMGDFPLLRNLLLKKKHIFTWMLFGWIDALLRGIGQVVFANNPISGLLTIAAFGLSVPGNAIAGTIAGFLGLLLSLVSWRCTGGQEKLGGSCVSAPQCGPLALCMVYSILRDSIENGLTVYNPFLIGCVTYTFLPTIYYRLDIFVIFIIIVGTIFSVYLTRSLATGRFPCITVPFNIVQILILLILSMQRNVPGFMDTKSATAAGIGIYELGNNQTALSAANGTAKANLTDEILDWGLVFRGVVVSPSQVYTVDNVVAGSVIYLGILIYSPTSALFSVLGALSGCLVALGLRVPYAAVYSGLWGYNSLLTGTAFGGLFLVITKQTGAATFVAIVFTTLFQYVAEPLMAQIGLPVLTVPFVVTAWLFFGLRDTLNGTFPKPLAITFPESELHNFTNNNPAGAKLYTVEDGSDPETSPDEKKPPEDSIITDVKSI